MICIFIPGSARVSLLITNLIDEDPPILGNETGSTSFNSGNTFPSLFDTVGRMYSINVKFMFWAVIESCNNSDGLRAVVFFGVAEFTNRLSLATLPIVHYRCLKSVMVCRF